LAPQRRTQDMSHLISIPFWTFLSILPFCLLRVYVHTKGKKCPKRHWNQV
jgi:hypothetical protein